MAQPRIGLLVVGFGGFNEAVKLSAGSHPVGRITEEPVLATDNKGPDGPLSRVVIYQEVTGLGVPHEFVPAAGQVANSLTHCILCRDLRLSFFQPSMQLRRDRQALMLAIFVTLFVADVVYVALDAVELVDQIQRDIGPPGFALGLYFLRFNELAPCMRPATHALKA